MIELKQNKEYHGFYLNRVSDIADIAGVGYMLTHKKSGAVLFYIESDDKNKVFSIAFKTPPTDDCGTAHIIEHSVLCGSRKYQAKDPFNELAKGSLNTFLNAMTYADKTVYPIASCNEEDFHHLMDVYLDAVFYPNIYQKKEIFQQEGWRYELDERKLDISGIVYNEMKGAFSDPESILGGHISKSIFGDTTYGFESGGTPEAIPNLTYEEFLDFHKEHYHPANAIINLYGQMDVERALAHLDSYLRNFDTREKLPPIEASAYMPKQEIIYKTYPAEEEGASYGNDGYFAYTFKVGNCTDLKKTLAIQLLSTILLETNASLLKLALQEARISDEVEGWFDTSTYEMVFSIVAKKTKSEDIDRFIEIIHAGLQKTFDEGFDEALFKSCIHRFEFLLREGDYGSMPKGLIYCLKSLKALLHGEEPFSILSPFSKLESLKTDMNYWKNLVSEVFINNTAKSIIVFTPEEGKGVKEQQALASYLEEKRLHLSEDEKEILRKEADSLHVFQEADESLEVLAQIPILELNQVEKKRDYPKFENLSFEGIPYLSVPLESNGISYMKLQFRLEILPEELLPYAGLLADILGKLDTESYVFSQLPIEIQNLFGGLSFRNHAYTKSAIEFKSVFQISAKMLASDFEKGLHFLHEILFKTDFAMKDNLRKIIRTARINGESYFLNNPHGEAVRHSMSYLSAGTAVSENVKGITYFHFLKEIEETFDKNSVEIISKLQKTMDLLFQKNNLFFAVGGGESELISAIQHLKTFIRRLPERESSIRKYLFTAEEKQIAFSGNGTVQYNVLSANYFDFDFQYQGQLQVLKTIINLEYLWSKIRVKGGAYGAGSNFKRDGLCYFYSYRDPHLEKTYETYRALGEELLNFSASKREMTKYILGTMSRLDQPKTNTDIFAEAIELYHNDISETAMNLEREEILLTTVSDIRNFAELFFRIGDTNNICTIGNEQRVQASATLFEKIKKLI